MKARKWDAKIKAKIILEGVKGKKIADICNEYKISPTQYYQWREQFLSNINSPFEVGKKANRELALERENRELRELVGELSLELKKTGMEFA